MTQKLFYWYLANQDELVKQYAGKVLVINNNQVMGAFDSYQDADVYAVAHFSPNTYILQRCSNGDIDYIVTLPRQVRFHGKAL